MAEHPRRTRPLSAAPIEIEQIADEEVAGIPVAPPAGDAAAATEDSRYQRLAEGVRSLRTGGGTLNLSEHTLMVLGGVIAPLGLVIVILGWYGAAHSPFLFQQVPYLISGLGLGLGLVFLGSFFYFAHWITELVKQGRTQSAAMIEAIARLEETVKQQTGADRVAAAGDGGGLSPNGAATGELVATGKGTMAHRPDCVVVAGKPGMRPVSPDDGLISCKLCDPYAEAAVAQ